MFNEIENVLTGAKGCLLEYRVVYVSCLQLKVFCSLKEEKRFCLSEPSKTQLAIPMGHGRVTHAG